MKCYLKGGVKIPMLKSKYNKLVIMLVLAIFCVMSPFINHFSNKRFKEYTAKNNSLKVELSKLQMQSSDLSSEKSKLDKSYSDIMKKIK